MHPVVTFSSLLPRIFHASFLWVLFVSEIIATKRLMMSTISILFYNGHDYISEFQSIWHNFWLFWHLMIVSKMCKGNMWDAVVKLNFEPHWRIHRHNTSWCISSRYFWSEDRSETNSWSMSISSIKIGSKSTILRFSKLVSKRFFPIGPFTLKRYAGFSIQVNQ